MFLVGESFAADSRGHPRVSSTGYGTRSVPTTITPQQIKYSIRVNPLPSALIRVPQNSVILIMDMDKLVSLCKRRGFLFQSSEIYGGLNGFWDYGPLGVELKRNIKEAWWRDMVTGHDDLVTLARRARRATRWSASIAPIIMHPQVWKCRGITTCSSTRWSIAAPKRAKGGFACRSHSRPANARYKPSKHARASTRQVSSSPSRANST